MSQRSKLIRLFKEHRSKQIHGLKNDVHPLFTKERFDKKINYEALLPSLQLVTHLLSTPQMRHFFGTLFFGDLEHVGKKDQYGVKMKSVHWPVRVHELSPKLIEMVDERVVALSRMIRFGIREGDYFHADCGHVHYSIDWENRVCYSKQKTVGYDFGLLGTESKISLSTREHERLISVHNTFACTGKDNLWFRFHVATSILHELGHAACNAALGREYFFEDGLIQEIGYEAEVSMFGLPQRLFSYTDDLSFSKDNPLLYLTAFPDKDRIDDRETAKRPLECRDRSALVDGADFEMPAMFVVSVFQEWFWAEMGKTLDARVLIPAANEEYLAKQPSNGVRMPVPERVVDLFRFPAALRDSTEVAIQKQDLCPTEVISVRHAAYESWKRKIEDGLN